MESAKASSNTSQVSYSSIDVFGGDKLANSDAKVSSNKSTIACASVGDFIISASGSERFLTWGISCRNSSIKLISLAIFCSESKLS